MGMCSSDARIRGSTRPPPEKERSKLGKRGWSLMIFCARATRALRRASLGLMARLGVPVGGRVRKLRAVEDQSASIPEEITSELGGIICNLARRPQWDQHGCHSLNRSQPFGRRSNEQALEGALG